MAAEDVNTDLNAFLSQEKQDLAELGLDGEAVTTPAAAPLTTEAPADLTPAAGGDDLLAAFETSAPPAADINNDEGNDNENNKENESSPLGSDWVVTDSNGGLDDGLVPPVTAAADPVPAPRQPDYSSIPKPEPETIRKWKIEFADRLEKKDKAEKEAIEEIKTEASKQLEKFHKDREEQLNNRKKENRNAEEEFCAERDAVGGGKEWERIGNLCEFNPKNSKCTKDVSRMRSLLLQRKANDR